MKWTKRSFLELIAILVLAGVVIVLAVLQYKWTGEISGIEENRMEAALDASVKNFNQEFSYDFERLGENFEIPPGASVDNLEAPILSRYAVWNKSAVKPDFVGGIYLWKINKQRTSPLEFLDSQTRRFKDIAWPEKFASANASLKQVAGQLAAATPDREAVYYPWTFYEDAFVLVRPIFQVSGAANNTSAGARPVAFLMLGLNGPFLTQVYFPQLIERTFGGLDFAVAVRTAHPPYRAIYLSDSGFPLSTHSPDAEVNLFDSVAEEAHRRGHATIQTASPAAQWQLAAQHRSGSLEAAVGSWRRRNFAISIGLLSVLAACVVLIFSVARRAERFAKLQMEFVAGVSHELCTPLAVINSAVENLADGVVENPGQVQEYAGILREQGNRLERLLDQVLLFASERFKASQYDLRPVALGPIVEQSLAACEPMLRDAGFRLEKNLSTGLPAVIADPGAVGRCIDNLISNAMKYSGDKAWLAVRAGLVREDSHDEVQVSVEDSGMGIPGADLPHIFEPFYRVQAARDGQIRGVGLGLHLVQRMMQGMGGRVTVSSQLGRGTCFVLHFQICTAGQEHNQHADPHTLHAEARLRSG